jgi:UDP-glucose:(heptosyl)LPS alpha-1,3-glucosyltransferase
VARGHDVHLFGRLCPAVPAEATFHRVPALALGRAIKTLSFQRRVDGRVDRERFDLVQGFDKTTCQTVHRTGGGVHRAYLARTGARGGTFYDRVVVGIEDRLFESQRLRAVVCPSRWVAHEVARHYPAVEGLCRVIPNGVDLAAFGPEAREDDRGRLLAPLGITGDASVALFVATNFRLKGLDRAVEALARVPGLHLVVVGAGDPGHFAARAAALGCGDRIRFVGGTLAPAPWYRAADVLIHPTRYDPFANVCLEAAACGTPVVTTEANGAADVLVEEPEAARVVREDPDALARAVQDLLALGGRARGAALALARAHTLEDHVVSIETLYGRIAAGET